MKESSVRAWNEVVVIPTYSTGKPEKNPVFPEKRVYQGSSGLVYPHPVIEKIENESRDVEWNAVFLENEYVKIMILPELGGRIQMAYDKIAQRHFVYYNQVIKPALVGLAGPWISGGIEFNWPQHHRPSTFQPLSWSIEDHADGSVTVWCSEVERMCRTKGMAGFRLYPGKAYLEINVRLYNRTPHPQTFLWWANPAVKVNDAYQSVFPPDVHAVFDHGRRDVSTFPVATGTYYKVDYSAGVDISKYANIPVPTSYMAVESKFDFVGGYENDTRAGMLHVASHHISPGKKQWTWGHGDFGRAWDRNLTDEDGPYIELMCGVYTDNQPDFSWLMPYEERDFTQYFMPYRDLGLVKNATRDALLNLEFESGKAIVKAFTTAAFPGARLQLRAGGELLLDEVLDFSPLKSYEKTIISDSALSPEDFRLSLHTQEGRLLVEYQPEKPAIAAVPEPARAPGAPGEIGSAEELYLIGLHLEQYRHATFNPADYYREALRREPGDVRNNNAMGLLHLRNARYVQAEPYFLKAIQTLTTRNPNPREGEPFYQLGLCQLFQGKPDEAFGRFYKATWNAAWQDAAWFNLARISALRGDRDEALDHVNHALSRNAHHHEALHLKTAILRHLNRKEEAGACAETALARDGFNLCLLFEQYLLKGSPGLLDLLRLRAGNSIHNFIEYSLNYALAGMYPEAQQFLRIGIDACLPEYPMAWYLMGWYAMGAPFSADVTPAGDEAIACFRKAAAAVPDYCFPNRAEEVAALQCALRVFPEDAKALYYLGNFWYHTRQYDEAVSCWERSIGIDPGFPTVRRNLALACYNKQAEPVRALEEMKAAFRQDTTDARILMELDQLTRKMNFSPAARLEFLEAHMTLVEYRDDLYLERISLCNHLGDFGKALNLLTIHQFHPWEGGEGKVTGQFLLAHTELAKQALSQGNPDQALFHLKATENYPFNLGEGKLPGTHENDIHYWKGCAFDQKGEPEQARICWEQAASGPDEPTHAIFYNDQHPDKIYYQGLALMKLGKPEQARIRFRKLEEFGEAHLHESFEIDYFAVSLPDLQIWEEDLNRRNEINSRYLMALGLLGRGETAKAREQFNRVIAMDCNHQGVRQHINSPGQ
jgi:tetratricopeptide (TPR) repeat protein